MTTTTQKTLKHVLQDPAVDTTLTLVAAMVGLSKAMASRIVASGLPLMATVADADPGVFKALFAQSVQYLPQPMPAAYAKSGKNAGVRQTEAAGFQGIYGPMTETIHRETARHASATEQQTRQVLAALMPAAVKALGKANSNGNEMGFGRQLRNLNA